MEEGDARAGVFAVEQRQNQQGKPGEKRQDDGTEGERALRPDDTVERPVIDDGEVRGGVHGRDTTASAPAPGRQ